MLPLAAMHVLHADSSCYSQSDLVNVTFKRDLHGAIFIR